MSNYESGERFLHSLHFSLLKRSMNPKDKKLEIHHMGKKSFLSLFITGLLPPPPGRDEQGAPWAHAAELMTLPRHCLISPHDY